MTTKMHRYALVIFFQVIFSYAFCQRININPNSIFNETHFYPAKFPFLIITLPSSDCYKCRAPLSQVIQAFNKANIGFDTSRSYLVSDNYSLAKDFIEENETFLRIKVQKNINQTFCPDGRSVVYLYLSKDSGFKYYLEDLGGEHIQQIPYLFAGSQVPPFKAFSFRDSVFSKNSFQVIFSGGNVAFFDPVLQKGAFTRTQNTLSYVKPLLGNYSKMQTFFAKSDTEGYVLVTEKEINKFIRTTKLPLIHINSMLFRNDSVHCFFTVNRYLRKSINDSNIIISPRNYLAIKEAKTKNQFLSIFDLSSYDSYKIFEVLSSKNSEYIPVNLSPMFMTEKITDDGYWIRMQEVKAEQNSGTILSFVKLTDSVPVIVKLDSTLTIEDRFFILSKSNGEQFICSIDSSQTNKAVEENNGHLFLNKTNGFHYLYDYYVTASDRYNMIYSPGSGNIFLAEINLLERKIESNNDISHLFKQPVDEIICLKNSVLAVGKDMLNEDYNIGIIHISLIPKTSLALTKGTK